MRRYYNCIEAFEVPDQRKFPERGHSFGNEKGRSTKLRLCIERHIDLDIKMRSIGRSFQSLS